MAENERINQTELPLYGLRDALRIPLQIQREYAGRPTAPVDVAMAVGVKPSSSGWRYLTGAAVGYGLVDGGYNAAKIGLTELGRRIVAPTLEGDDRAASIESVLKPSVVGGFLRKYDGAKFPRPDIARNVLQSEFAVPLKRLDSALEVIVANAEAVGFFREIGGDRYVSIGGTGLAPSHVQTPGRDVSDSTGETDTDGINDESDVFIAPPLPDRLVDNPLPRRVFISHGKNRKILDQVKQMLELGDFVPEVAVDQETGAIPVPDKVFDAMRQCGAAIICVTADELEGRPPGDYEVNPNVLIEIGAAYVLYEKRLILLWDRRVPVPSNLQGLYRCEFEGNELTWDAGTKLQKALISFKKGEAPA